MARNALGSLDDLGARDRAAAFAPHAAGRLARVARKEVDLVDRVPSAALRKSDEERCVILAFAACARAHEALVLELGADVEIGLVVRDGAAHAEVARRRAGDDLAELRHRRRPFARDAVELDLPRLHHVRTDRDAVRAAGVGQREARREGEERSYHLRKLRSHAPEGLHDLDRGNDRDR